MKTQYHLSKSSYVDICFPSLGNLLRLGIVASTLLIALPGVVLGDEAPPFVQVGKSYSGAGIQFYVLEVGKAGWVKVVLRQTNQLGWINTNSMSVIAPYPAVSMDAPAAVPWQ